MRYDVFQCIGSCPVSVIFVVRGKSRWASWLGKHFRRWAGIRSGVGASEDLVFMKLVASCCRVGMVARSCDGVSRWRGGVKVALCSSTCWSKVAGVVGDPASIVEK